MQPSQEINNLPSQFRNTDGGSNQNLHKLLTALTLPFQQFNENLSDQSNAILDVLNSKGSQLDIIGKLIDAMRESFDDDNFRLDIKLKTKLNNADGTPNFVMFAVDNALSTNQNFYIEGTAEAILHLNLQEELTQKQLKILRNTVPDGVKLRIYYTLNEEIFVLSETFVPFLIGDGSEALAVTLFDEV